MHQDHAEQIFLLVFHSITKSAHFLLCTSHQLKWLPCVLMIGWGLNRRAISGLDISFLPVPFQGYKVELASKQLTMEFVNQSVLQPGPHEIDVPHEKLDYAEKLAELNQRWTKVRVGAKECTGKPDKGLNQLRVLANLIKD